MGEHFWGEVPVWLRRASHAFGGGVAGSQQELCGALGGAVLTTSARYGRTDFAESDDRLFGFLAAYRERFIAEFGDSQCEAIRSRLPEGDNRCLPVVETATRILVQMLDAWDLDGE